MASLTRSCDFIYFSDQNYFECCHQEKEKCNHSSSLVKNLLEQLKLSVFKTQNDTCVKSDRASKMNHLPIARIIYVYNMSVYKYHSW